MRLLIGIDDTDNVTSGGTGNLTRDLRKQIVEQNLAQTIGITRHQLFLSPEIPYTSHNSSACIMLETPPFLVSVLTDYCREYLIKYSEPGSDVGLCVAEWDKVDSATQTFGKQAKEKVLTQAEAISMASQAGVFLEGLTGTKEGIIGALAAVGLRKSGNDGRFLWVPGLYEVSSICTVRQLYQTASIDRIQDLEGNLVLEDTKIKTSPWPRPVLIDGQAVMLVVKTIDNSHQIGDKNYEYEMAPKNVIRRY
jgi:hypothetical protein